MAENILSLRPATPEQYADFLMAYLLNNDGKITHIYDYTINRANILYTNKSVTIPKAAGAAALNVISTKDAIVTRISHGKNYVHDHGRTYSLEGRVNSDNISWIPLYTDVAQIMLNKGWKFEKVHFSTPSGRTDFAINGLICGIVNFSLTGIPITLPRI